MDTADAVLVDFGPHPPALLATHAEPLPPALREQLMALCEKDDDELRRMAQLDVTLGRLFAAAAKAVLAKSGIEASAVRAIGSHGQTVRHHPHGPTPFSLQIGDPNTIAEMTGITTVADFRRRDIAAGGQGAPLVPAFHAAMFRTPDHERVILNLGGIANITLLPSDARIGIGGFDTGPANVLMDAWTAKHLGQPMDEGGRWAASGTVDSTLLSAMLADPYFALDPPKSTGREYFNLNWIRRAIQQFKPAPSPADVQATLAELTAASVALAIATHAPATGEVLVCGGGTRNGWLQARLRAWLQHCRVSSTAEHGIPGQWVEAMAFAWLARQSLAGLAGNVPGVTGARRPVVLGGIYR